MVNKRTTMNLHLPIIFLYVTSCVQTEIIQEVPTEPVIKQVHSGDKDLYGYNSLKGCPLTSGRDPGFTLPIFSAKGHVTPEFHYSLPSEFIVSHDVSCVTMFTSEVVMTPYDLTKLLSLTARVGDNSWGPPFSASQNFQKLSSELTQNILIVSTAVCSVFDVSLHSKLPSFDSSFVEWIFKLNNTNDENIYLEFLNTYGTHFVSRARFGASVTVVYKMKDTVYWYFTNGFNTSYASQSSAALFGHSETLTYEQQKLTEDFQNYVETTTFSVGVPLPYKGNSLTWLTAVKDNPCVIDYDLTTMEALFSHTFMGKESYLQYYDIDYTTIYNNIMAAKTKFCKPLMRENLLDDCKDNSGLTLVSTKLIGSSTRRAVESFDQCYEECYQLPGCVAVTFCHECTTGNQSRECEMFSAGEIQRALTDYRWKTTIFVNKLKTFVKLQNTTVVVNSDPPPNFDSVQDCYPSCIEDTECLAFTLYDISESIIKCTHHRASILSLTKETGVSVYFLSPLVKRIIRSRETKGLAPFSTLNGWYNSTCVIDDECHQKNSKCFLNRCLCRPGFFFSPRDYTCSDTCSPADLHNTFVEYRESGIRGHDIVARDKVSLQTCKNLCNSIRDCWSFDFRATGGRCLLHDIVSQGLSYPQTSRGWTHYQRNCLQSPGSYPGPVWYNELCHSNAECPEPNSQCISRRCLCSPGFVFVETDTSCHAAESCAVWKRSGGKSGVYFIQLPGTLEQLRVWCDMDSDNGAWLVFQRRLDGSVDFFRNWVQYENGFGDITWEFWLGLSKLHTLVKGKPHRLRIDLGQESGARTFAEYAVFSVDGPETNYTLHATNYSGNAGDGLSRHDTMKFSTYDQDNDATSKHNCARDFYGGWWFLWCHPVNLNGRYGAGLWEGVIWNSHPGFTFTEMKLREV